MFSIKILKAALLDLEERTEYYNTISPSLKEKFLKNFDATLIKLQEFPYFQIRYDNFRIRQVKGFPIIIHYILLENEREIRIYGVRFGMENPLNYPKT